MKRLLALINWPTKDKHNTAEEFDLPFTVDTHLPRRKSETDTQPMVRIGDRDPKDIQKAIDLAG